MPADTPSSTTATLLGAAHLAWAAILCAGGIYGLAASQPATSDLAELLGFWNQSFAATGVSSIVAIALLHGWGGQSLRRGGAWPATCTWGLLAAGALLALAGGWILSRGMTSRLLLAGAAPLVAVIVAGGIGTLILAGVTRWLVRQDVALGEPDERPSRDETDRDSIESTLLLGMLAALPACFAAAMTAVTIGCEVMGS